MSPKHIVIRHSMVHSSPQNPPKSNVGGARPSDGSEAGPLSSNDRKHVLGLRLEVKVIRLSPVRNAQ